MVEPDGPGEADEADGQRGAVLRVTKGLSIPLDELAWRFTTSRRPRRSARQQDEHPGRGPLRHRTLARPSDRGNGPDSSNGWVRPSGCRLGRRTLAGAQPRRGPASAGRPAGRGTPHRPPPAPDQADARVEDPASGGQAPAIDPQARPAGPRRRRVLRATTTRSWEKQGTRQAHTGNNPSMGGAHEPGRGSGAEPVSDSAIISTSLSEPEVFATLVDRHLEPVYRYLARRVGRQVADDLAAECFLVASRSPPVRSDPRRCPPLAVRHSDEPRASPPTPRTPSPVGLLPVDATGRARRSRRHRGPAGGPIEAAGPGRGSCGDGSGPPRRRASGGCGRAHLQKKRPRSWPLPGCGTVRSRLGRARRRLRELLNQRGQDHECTTASPYDPGGCP